MSKGLGYWQQMIINELEANPTVRVGLLTGGGLDYKQYNALNRAAHSLRDRGLIGLIRAPDLDCRGQGNVRLLAIRKDKIALLEAQAIKVDTVQNRTESTLNNRALSNSYRTIAKVTDCSKSKVWSTLKAHGERANKGAGKVESDVSR